MKYLIFFFLLFTVGLQAQTCAGVTKANVPCKNKAAINDTKCKLHSDNTIRCGQQTKTGGTCRMIVKQPSDRCRFHKL